MLSRLKNVHLIEPLDYAHFIWLMNKSYVVLTDSGGLQEEAPALGKPVLVMRDVTERQEGIDSGTALLVGTDKDKIINSLSLLLTDQSAYEKMAKAVSPYGDGTACGRIVEIISELSAEA
jgi:UDP-N-acetylglucosamine 2-epimerase (non-hydrolysing)